MALVAPRRLTCPIPVNPSPHSARVTVVIFPKWAPASAIESFIAAQATISLSPVDQAVQPEYEVQRLSRCSSIFAPAMGTYDTNRYTRHNGPPKESRVRLSNITGRTKTSRRDADGLLKRLNHWPLRHSQLRGSPLPFVRIGSPEHQTALLFALTAVIRITVSSPDSTSRAEEIGNDRGM